MTELEKGTAIEEAVEYSDPSELREFEGDEAPAENNGQAAQEEGATEGASSQKPRSKVLLLLTALGLGVAAGASLGFADRASPVREAKKEMSAGIEGKDNQAAGACKAWVDIICERMGELAYECTEARIAATTLLSDESCARAHESVLAKIESLRGERLQCRELTSKLCGDLGPEGKGCEFAKAREPAFSPGECQNMMEDYEQVLARVMDRQEKGTIPRPPSARRDVSISKVN